MLKKRKGQTYRSLLRLLQTEKDQRLSDMVNALSDGSNDTQLPLDLAVCAMLCEGFSLSDTLDPEKKRSEKKSLGKTIRTKLASADNNWRLETLIRGIHLLDLELEAINKTLSLDEFSAVCDLMVQTAFRTFYIVTENCRNQETAAELEAFEGQLGYELTCQAIEQKWRPLQAVIEMLVDLRLQASHYVYTGSFDTADIVETALRLQYLSHPQVKKADHRIMEADMARIGLSDSMREAFNKTPVLRYYLHERLMDGTRLVPDELDENGLLAFDEKALYDKQLASYENFNGKWTPAGILELNEARFASLYHERKHALSPAILYPMISESLDTYAKALADSPGSSTETYQKLQALLSDARAALMRADNRDSLKVLIRLHKMTKNFIADALKEHTQHNDRMNQAFLLFETLSGHISGLFDCLYRSMEQAHSRILRALTAQEAAEVFSDTFTTANGTIRQYEAFAASLKKTTGPFIGRSEYFIRLDEALKVFLARAHTLIDEPDSLHARTTYEFGLLALNAAASEYVEYKEKSLSRKSSTRLKLAGELCSFTNTQLLLFSAILGKVNSLAADTAFTISYVHKYTEEQIQEMSMVPLTAESLKHQLNRVKSDMDGKIFNPRKYAKYTACCELAGSMKGRRGKSYSEGDLLKRIHANFHSPLTGLMEMCLLGTRVSFADFEKCHKVVIAVMDEVSSYEEKDSHYLEGILRVLEGAPDAYQTLLTDRIIGIPEELSVLELGNMNRVLPAYRRKALNECLALRKAEKAARKNKAPA